VPIADRPHPQTPPNFFVQNLDIEQHLVSPAALGHSKAYPMQAQYITIHSTGNASLKAPDFAARMARGDLISTPRTPTTKPGRLSWHYTVDEDRVIQHLPLDCQGGHADFNGPGNRTSIGIEMCENRGANLALTIERTARLAAYLMHLEHLPLTHVVPHHYWPRPTQQPVHKCCPHFLMERDGHPGAKWQHFIDRVAFYDQALAGSLAAR
jgi:N-acetylmuramoyl-L-alanine amidase